MSSRGRPMPTLAAFSAAALLAVSGCTASATHTSGHSTEAAPVAGSTGPDHGHASSEPVAPAPAVPLRAGETRTTSAMPEAYLPVSRNGASDDYRCFLVDPGLTEDRFLTGVTFRPGNPTVVHHIVLFRVDADRVAAGQDMDASSDGPGWPCFGGPGFATTTGGGSGPSLTAAPWLAAWAPGGREQVWREGLGVRLERGSAAVLQVHYNLRAGDGEDVTAVDWRTVPGDADITPIETRLLVAPVELECAPGESGHLCDRTASVFETVRRFGQGSGATIAGLQLLCDGDPMNPVPGPTQSCDHPVRERVTIYAAAAHMHLLGRSMRIELNPGTDRATTILDVPAYDFDNQGAIPLPQPVVAEAGDTLRITCTHDVGLRAQLPAFQGLEPRYVTWGEGTTDEMCLGIISYSRDG